MLGSDATTGGLIEISPWRDLLNARSKYEVYRIAHKASESIQQQNLERRDSEKTEQIQNQPNYATERSYHNS